MLALPQKKTAPPGMFPEPTIRELYDLTKRFNVKYLLICFDENEEEGNISLACSPMVEWRGGVFLHKKETKP